MRDLVVSSIGPRIELRLHRPAADLPAALADPNQLELALLNLCVNARDAMDGGGMLTVAAEHAVIGPDAGGKLKPGAYVRLSVIDSGIGHGRRDAGPGGRAVLLDQGRRQGHRPWPVDGARARRPSSAARSS